MPWAGFMTPMRLSWLLGGSFKCFKGHCDECKRVIGNRSKRYLSDGSLSCFVTKLLSICLRGCKALMHTFHAPKSSKGQRWTRSCNLEIRRSLCIPDQKAYLTSLERELAVALKDHRVTWTSFALCRIESGNAEFDFQIRARSVDSRLESSVLAMKVCYVTKSLRACQPSRFIGKIWSVQTRAFWLKVDLIRSRSTSTAKDNAYLNIAIEESEIVGILVDETKGSYSCRINFLLSCESEKAAQRAI